MLRFISHSPSKKVELYTGSCLLNKRFDCYKRMEIPTFETLFQRKIQICAVALLSGYFKVKNPANWTGDVPLILAVAFQFLDNLIFVLFSRQLERDILLFTTHTRPVLSNWLLFNSMILFTYLLKLISSSTKLNSSTNKPDCH